MNWADFVFRIWEDIVFFRGREVRTEKKRKRKRKEREEEEDEKKRKIELGKNVTFNLFPKILSMDHD